MTKTLHRVDLSVLTVYISYFLFCCNKIPDQNKLGKEMFVLAHNLKRGSCVREDMVAGA